jgi:hypothetical protein
MWLVLEHAQRNIIIHGMLVCWYAGMLVCWYAGMLVCWYAGMLVCWYAGMPVCWYAMLVCYAGMVCWYGMLVWYAGMVCWYGMLVWYAGMLIYGIHLGVYYRVSPTESNCPNMWHRRCAGVPRGRLAPLAAGGKQKEILAQYLYCDKVNRAAPHPSRFVVSSRHPK